MTAILWFSGVWLASWIWWLVKFAFLMLLVLVGVAVSIRGVMRGGPPGYY